MEENQVEIITDGLVVRQIEGSCVHPMDDDREARRSLTRRGYRLVQSYRDGHRRGEVWERRRPEVLR